MTLKQYQPQQFEFKWSDKWNENKTYRISQPDAKHKKQFIFPMFPYPSGAGLHVGHVRVYTGTDVIARFYRMNQYAVLHPIGWDAFGLPAENAAIKAKKNPMDMVPHHIATFRRQMQSLGFSFDWDREFATTDPKYYKWTQWLFIQFFNMGLLYKKNAPINFCPICKTGLSEEEVLPNGTHERCGNKIEKRDLPQWLFKITSYADRLLSDLEGLDWPRGILEMQRNWIGKKEGINITYKVIDSSTQSSDLTNARYRVSRFEEHPSELIGSLKNAKQVSSRSIHEKIAFDSSKNTYLGEITCFTTRPDTNFGATFIVIAPEHEFVTKILNNKLKVDEKTYKEITKYVEKTKSKTEVEREAEGREKTGVFTGFYAINNLNNKRLPIWISDFVLMGFGTGAVVGVPGHDMRDFEFAKEFGIEVVRVVVGKDGDTGPITKKEQVQEESGTMINSEFLNGIEIHEAIKKIMNYLEEKGWGKRVATYHLRDWIFSRQRYWGEPIPIIECKKCGLVPVPEDQLPVKLPYVKSYEPSGTGESPLASIKEWVNVKCPKCGEPAKRETDTMPNWAGSCWYFIAFSFWNQYGDSSTQFLSQRTSPSKKRDSRSEKIAFDSSLSPSIENWKLLMENYGIQWLPSNWYIGGAEHAVLHLLYARFWVKALYDLKLLNFKEPFMRLRNLGMILAEDHRKMSKSFGNVINPDDVQKEYGADALRIYEMFMAPFDQEISWSTKTLQGSYRFMTRAWKLFHDPKQIGNISNPKLFVKLQKTIAKVTRDIPEVKFNTAVAAMMEFINEWENKTLSKDDAKKFLQILAPFAPFMTEEIWYEIFGEKNSIHLSVWPKVDESEIKGTEVSIPVQVNGKVRAVLVLRDGETDEQPVVERAVSNEQVKKYVAGKKYKIIYVKGKILNLVV